MKRFSKLLGTLGLALFAVTAVAQAGMDGTWECKSGNIPIALITISGSSYQMLAVSDTAWTVNPSGKSTGDGEVDVQGNMLMPLSGPLQSVYRAIGEYCDPTEGGCDTEYLSFSAPTSPFNCWRH